MLLLSLLLSSLLFLLLLDANPTFGIFGSQTLIPEFHHERRSNPTGWGFGGLGVLGFRVAKGFGVRVVPMPCEKGELVVVKDLQERLHRWMKVPITFSHQKSEWFLVEEEADRMSL